MNNHKTAGHYLLELLKILIFGALLAWLVSCSNRKQRTIDLIHTYVDSLGAARAKVRIIEYQAERLQSDYEAAYEPKWFENTAAGDRLRSEWLAKERAAYRRLLQEKNKYESATYQEKLNLIESIGRYKQIIDSLKIELY